MANSIRRPKLNSKGLDKIFGEGIDVLISDIESNEELKANTIEIELNQLRPNPYQPRKIFSDVEITELGLSIVKHGVIQPILVRKSIHGYDIIAGERRVRASKKAGLNKIPAIIVDFDDTKMMEVAIIENLQRVDLNIIEEALAYEKLIKTLKLQHGDIAMRVGKSRAHITNTLRILSLPEEVQNLVLAGKITMGHVKPLVVIAKADTEAELKSKTELIKNLVNEIIEKKLTVREAEDLARKHLAKSEKQIKKVVKKNDNQIHFEALEAEITKKLGTKVKIKENKIVISFKGNKNLNNILKVLNIIE